MFPLKCVFEKKMQNLGVLPKDKKKPEHKTPPQNNNNNNNNHKKMKIQQ